MDSLYQSYRSLLDDTSTKFVRYLHDEINWEARFVAILGARGVGKTTMMLQHILLTKQEDKSLYISANDSYFATRSLYDTAREFYNNGGKYLYIDEVHKYTGWSNEVKEMYDKLKGLQVVISGSSILEITRGIDADLSRRVVFFNLEGLSFREYLNFKYKLNIQPYTLEDILAGKMIFPNKLLNPLPIFNEYLEHGYFPFFNEPYYEKRLRGTISSALEQDIATYANLSPAVVRKLKQLLSVITSSVPFKPNYSELARMVDVDRKLLPTYLLYMHKAALIRLLPPEGESVATMEKAEKVYLGNTNYINVMNIANPNEGNIRETFFYASMLVRHRVTSSNQTDFIVDGYSFELGGKNKKQKQIQGIENAYVVKDDIEYAYRNVIPLWMFGMNY